MKNQADPFALLDLPRRPCIERELLEEKFRQLAARAHPDQARGNTRLLLKLAAGDEGSGAPARSPGVYKEVLEDASTGATPSFASAVEVRKKSTTSFEQLQEAANLLRHTATRLRYLAGGATASPMIPAVAQELFSTIAAALEDGKKTLADYHGASGALAKALLMNKMKTALAALKSAQGAVEKWHTSLDKELQSLDVRWPEVSREELLSLASAFTFVIRWEGQLREELLAFTILLG